MVMESGMRHEEPRLDKDAIEAFDLTPAPEGKIEDEGLADMEAGLDSLANDTERPVELSHSEKLAMAPDFDQSPAPAGKIEDPELARLDRDLQRKKADEMGIHEVRKELGLSEEDDFEKKEAA